MQTKEGPARDRQTGRYRHEWSIIGSHESATEYREVAECEHCGKVRAYGGSQPDRAYKSREAAVRAGEVLFEGYAPEVPA